MKPSIPKQPLRNIIIIFMAPIIITVILFVFFALKNVLSIKYNMYKQFVNNFTEFTVHNKKLATNVFDDLSNISSFSSVKNIMSTSFELDPYCNDISDTQNLLKIYKQNNPIVHSICIVNKATNSAVTESNTYTIDDYFTQQCKYNSYDLTFWKTLRVSPSSPTLLDASECVFNNSDILTIPYVCTISGIANNSSYIIVNINLWYIYTMLKSQEYSPNSEILLMQNNSFQCLSSSGMTNFPFDNKELQKEFLQRNFSIYNKISFNNKNYYVMVASAANSLYNFSYIVCIPNSDISAIAITKKITFIFAIILEVIALVLAILVFIFKIYNPLSNINHIISGNGLASNNLFERIINYIRSSSDNILVLEDQLKEIIPVSVQAYLCSIIKKKDKRDTHFEKKVFAYSYFLPISVEIIFQKRFYDDINMPYLSTQAIDLIKSQFEIKLHTYCISSSTTTLSILVNLPSMDDAETVTEVINSTYKLFAADTIYISIYFGVGTLITDLSDLKQSLDKSLQCLHSEICDDRRNFTKSTTIFGQKENLQFTNYLVNGNTSAALELLDNVNSQLLDLPRAIIKNVYGDILFSIYRVMDSKGISTMQNTNGDISYISEKCSESQADIYEYAVQCIEKIGAMHNDVVKKISIDDVVEYICKHFNEDLSLDLLADRYGTSPQYLSKRLKQHLGLTFHDYISSLRVEKAKELLTTTDKGITCISEETGFVSRNTFLRIFKKYTGVPPSVYRLNNSNK